MRALRRAIFVIMSPILAATLAGCETPDNAADGVLIGPAAASLGNYYEWRQTDINTDITPSCGAASTAATTSTGGSSGSSGSSSSSSSADSDVYNISTYLQFKNNETLLIRWVYDRRRTSFTLSPETSNSQTCFTTDFVNCNGTSANPTCETTDGLKCGGTKAFIWTSLLPPLAFQARTGSIDYTGGLTLNANKDEVAFMDLEFNMLSLDNSSFRGKLTCTTTTN